MSVPSAIKAYIRQVLRADATFAEKLPGGIRFTDAPPKTRYPLLRCIGSPGTDVTPIGGGVIGGEMFYLITVVDHADTSERAELVERWMNGLLTDEASDHEVAGSWVYCRREGSVDSPFWNQGSLFQNVGGIYRFWVDLA